MCAFPHYQPAACLCSLHSAFVVSTYYTHSPSCVYVHTHTLALLCASCVHSTVLPCCVYISMLLTFHVQLCAFPTVSPLCVYVCIPHTLALLCVHIPQHSPFHMCFYVFPKISPCGVHVYAFPTLIPCCVCEFPILLL